MDYRMAVIALIGAASYAAAQNAPEAGAAHNVQVFERAVPGVRVGAPGGAVVGISGTASGHMGGAVGAPGDVLHFVASEFAFQDKAVKGAPYAAEAVTETVQTLSDGNRIVGKNSSQIFRDSEGRVRREQTLGVVGPWPAGKSHSTVFITDPVAGVSYVLEPESKVARKLSLPQLPHPGGPGHMGGMISIENRLPGGGPERVPAAAGADVMYHRRGEVKAVAVASAPAVMATAPLAVEAMHGSGVDIRNESLGTQTIEGVAAEGTRTTVTIPAGQIGNDRAIVTVSERWHSPELQVVVMTKRSDPCFGETVYKLQNIRRVEQPRNLFEPPADYTLQEASEPVRVRMRENAK